MAPLITILCTSILPSMRCRIICTSLGLCAGLKLRRLDKKDPATLPDFLLLEDRPGLPSDLLRFMDIDMVLTQAIYLLF